MHPRRRTEIVMQDDVAREIQSIAGDLSALRRELHACPELGFEEVQTAGIISARLRDAGLSVRTGVGKTGVVGILEGAEGGPTLMMRADIDGLPVVEETGLPFASTNGRMHACGHDGHVAITICAAEVLARHRESLKGRAAFVFQSAEEVTGGARAMIDDGVLDDVKPDRALGLHIWNLMPLGRVGVNTGTVFAGADAVRLTVRGRGGHGALPHTTIDPIVTAAEIVTAIQTVVSREIQPNQMSVLTFGQIHGGTAPNVIAEEVVLHGTVRAYTPEVRQQILDAAKRVATGVASAMRAEATFERLYGAPPVMNDPEAAAFITRHAAAVAGEEAVGPVEPAPVGDDMAEFLNRVPGCYFLLGAAKEGAQFHHNPRFDFDERCLPIGTEILVRAARDYLR